MDTLLDDLAAAIRERRRGLGLSQAELADLSGVSERTVRALEAGKRTARLDVVEQVCQTLGLELVARLKGTT